MASRALISCDVQGGGHFSQPSPTAVTAQHIAEGRSRLNPEEKNGISIRTKPAKQLEARLRHPQEDTAAVSRVFCEDKKVVVWF